MPYAIFCRLRRCVFSLVFFGGMLFLSAGGPDPLYGQRQPADAAEISRDLLYIAPQRIQLTATVPGGTRVPTLILLSGQAYLFSGGEIRPLVEQGLTSKDEDLAPKGKRTISIAGSEYTVTPHSDDDRATLTLGKAGEAAELVTAVLWTRDQLAAAWLPFLQSRRKTLTASGLRQDLEVGDPVIYDLQADGDSAWVAIGYSTGESELGIGSVVRFELAAKRAKVYQPRELSTCAVTQLAIAADKSLWVASRRQNEGSVLPCAGLLRIDPSTGSSQQVTLTGLPLEGTMVTAVGAAERLWVGTDGGICNSATGENWDCKRIAPVVSVKTETPVSNIPGEKPSGNLKPGDYEVRWANAGFLEVVTRDSFDAWIAADDFQEAAERNFDIEPYKLLNTSSGGPAPIRLMAKPGSDAAAAGALVYRATLEKLNMPAATPSGWVKVRAHTGWIERKNLEVMPKILPADRPAALTPASKPASHP